MTETQRTQATQRRRRTGPIVVICLGIVAAMLISLVLSIRGSIAIAQNFAEISSGYFSSDLMNQLVAHVDTQSGLVRMRVYDNQLAALIQDEERAGTSVTSSKCVLSLSKFVVEYTDGVAFIISSNSGTCYESNGTYFNLADEPELQMWAQAVRKLNRGGLGVGASAAEGYDDYFLHFEDGEAPSVYVGRPLYSEVGLQVGVVGVRVYGRQLERIMAKARETTGQDTLLVSAKGDVYLSTDDAYASGSSVKDLHAFQVLMARLGSNPKADASEKLWEGVDLFFPYDQHLYELTYRADFDCYLLTENRAEEVFDEVRKQVVSDAASMGVLLVLSMALVLAMVQWYRAGLLSMARIDELTGLPNRKSFSDAFDGLVSRGRLGDATLALIDIDLFKRVNDTFGHVTGDKALQVVADEVRGCVGETGICGRWGGDEFIAVIRADAEAAEDTLSALVEHVRGLRVDGCPPLTVSVGATHIDETLPLNRIIEQADAALYLTKDQGRNALNVYEDGVTPLMNEQ